MDEAAWRQQRLERVERPCQFERALLIGCVGCHCASRLALAEREVVHCNDSIAHEACADYLAHAAQRARFALHLLPGQPMAHAARMRIQCGGLHALARLTGPVESAPTAAASPDVALDVAGTLAEAVRRYGPDLERWPWEELVRAIRDWAPRRTARGAS
jgi:hypothetical protein